MPIQIGDSYSSEYDADTFTADSRAQLSSDYLYMECADYVVRLPINSNITCNSMLKLSIPWIIIEEDNLYLHSSVELPMNDRHPISSAGAQDGGASAQKFL